MRINQGLLLPDRSASTAELPSHTRYIGKSDAKTGDPSNLL
jgi:hypothetical protein